MLVGHLPAAYLLGHTVCKAVPSKQLNSRTIVLAALVGGILPDFDLIYFYTLGGKQVVHHQYWSHIPFFWVVIYLFVSLITLICQNLKVFKILSVVFSAIVLHLSLDTITGQIHWLYPFSATTFTLVSVPAVHEWWVANFLLHWTFAIELLLIFLALIAYVKRQHSLQGKVI